MNCMLLCKSSSCNNKLISVCADQTDQPTKKVSILTRDLCFCFLRRKKILRDRKKQMLHNSEKSWQTKISPYRLSGFCYLVSACLFHCSHVAQTLMPIFVGTLINPFIDRLGSPPNWGVKFQRGLFQLSTKGVKQGRRAEERESAKAEERESGKAGNLVIISRGGCPPR